MRHAILTKYLGERVTPAQLKAEVRKRFGVKPQSINPSDCFSTDSKHAGCTCPECGKLGGFAVNREGVVDMGASGWGSVSPKYVPTGKTRSSRGTSPGIAAPARKPTMLDPLAGFDWKTLYDRYDAACHGFNRDSRHLQGVYAGTTTDRGLYYKLVETAVLERGSNWYEALLYWKLYFQGSADSNITKLMRGFVPGTLHRLLAQIPSKLPRRLEDVIDVIESLGIYRLPGMKSPTALPVRTTFLHILYPDVVPIFDQMVLRAVGAWDKGANQQTTVLREYVPHAWELADKHTRRLAGFHESPIRLVDMVLWVNRGSA
jgi:hypothetical protein